MASAEQLKALLKSHLEGNEEQFYSVALQVAAHESRLGHKKLAEEIKNLIDKAKSKAQKNGLAAISIARPRGDLAALVNVSTPRVRLSSMVLTDELRAKLERIIKEQKHISKIRSYGLSPRRKLLLVGPPGTGKTLSASVLAAELGIPLFSVRFDSLITKFMGETAAKLRQVFDSMRSVRAVYFFDEFDAIGAHRSSKNDVGEIRRVLNSFLQMLEEDDSNSLVVAATNHPEILDYALFRRFDDIVTYRLPTSDQIKLVLSTKLSIFGAGDIDLQSVSLAADGLSYAEVARAAEEAMKHALISHHEVVTDEELRNCIKERKALKSE